ncbi:NAD(P)H-binding protein [Granulosicoccus sp. 3-233]|uniref:NAD(P)H-binding protein n=1 Tax=Granulosicoccus sp. 3-233 TaxID=3417969 RepID=UPI003D336F1D
MNSDSATRVGRYAGKALVLGATGGIGSEIADKLLRKGWHVSGLARDVEAAARGLVIADGIIWQAGDAMHEADVLRAAEGVDVIVHAVNPPGYRNWQTLVLPMLDNTIAAARAQGGARIVLPGTLYNFDAASSPVITEDTPQTANTRKGRIRIEMEKRLAAAAPEVPSLILRAGDFFGANARSSWFGQAMVASGKPVSRFVSVGNGAAHAHAYLPDLAECFARLIERRASLRPFECLQFAGHWDEDGQAMIRAVERVVGHDVPERRFPWWILRLLAPFGGFAREAMEVLPTWHHPMRLDNTRLLELLGEEPHTDWDEAVRQTLESMQALPDTLNTAVCR